METSNRLTRGQAKALMPILGHDRVRGLLLAEAKRLRGQAAELDALANANGKGPAMARLRPISPQAKAAAGRETKPKKAAATPALQRIRKFQGQYMAAVRALKARDKARVRKVLAKRGFPPAIKLARSLAR